MEDELLRDRVVVGIDSNELCEKLFSDSDLDLYKITQIYLNEKTTLL